MDVNARKQEASKYLDEIDSAQGELKSCKASRSLLRSKEARLEYEKRQLSAIIRDMEYMDPNVITPAKKKAASSDEIYQKALAADPDWVHASQLSTHHSTQSVQTHPNSSKAADLCKDEYKNVCNRLEAVRTEIRQINAKIRQLEDDIDSCRARIRQLSGL